MMKTTFENQVRQNLAPLFDCYRVEVISKGGDDSSDSPAYIILHLENVGLQIARDEIGTIIIRVFPARRPQYRWPIDYLQWFAEDVSDVPTTLSNRSLQEWGMWLVGSFDFINTALSENMLSTTVLQIDQLAAIQRQRFAKAFAEDPSILSKK